MPRFFVRICWANSATYLEDIDCGPILSAAIDLARKRATEDKTVRQATVMDDGGMQWAIFNMLWMIPEEAR